MSQRSLADDATVCLLLADEFEGRPEEALLLRLASEFQALANGPNPTCRIREGDLPYFALRASQEVTAAVKAEHPNARIAHLKMAQHYNAMWNRVRYPALFAFSKKPRYDVQHQS